MLDSTVNISRDYKGQGGGGGRRGCVLAEYTRRLSRGGKRAETGHAIHYHPVCVMTALHLRLDGDCPGQCT